MLFSSNANSVENIGKAKTGLDELVVPPLLLLLNKLFYQWVANRSGTKLLLMLLCTICV